MTRHLSQGSVPGRTSSRFTARARILVLACAALMYPASRAALAQEAGAESAPAHISFVEGNVILERDGQTDNSPASMPLLDGDRIRTQNGRAEILFADGSALHLDQQSVVDFQSDEVLRLLEGRMRLNIAGRSRDVSYRIDAPAAWVEIRDAGEYRVAVLRGEREPQVELAVLRGAAELVNEDGRSQVRAGERAFVRAGAQPSPPYVFNSAVWDAFDRWSESRRDQRLGVSAQYLPPDVRPYTAAFDRYGAWQYEQDYGYVWYPRVAVGWRPYYHGRWVGLRPYGWTWIGADPWGWPTHHYGRWGHSGSSWFWIPGRRWGAAWVSWAYAPDYVSWCPLGWNDRPLFSFVNINLNYRRGRYYDPWYAWTVLPRRHFGVGIVNANVVAARHLDRRVRGSFVERHHAPDWHHRGSRASVPIISAGRTGYAVPRGSASSGYAGSINRNQSPSASRNFPSPSREPRIPQVERGNASRSAAPVTIAPQRAVPRDRGVRPQNFGTPSNRGGGTVSPGVRRSPGGRSESDGRNDQPSAVPPAGTRAIPRGTTNDSADRPSAPGLRTYDRSPARTAPRSAPEYRPDSVPDGFRRPSGNENGGGIERSRAVPRQDAPRPSYDAPRPTYEAPRRSYEGPRSSPRSYGAPSQESRPPSYGGGSERRGSPSADRPSRGGSPSDSGGSRSRGGQPSQGQAVRRSRG